MLWLIYVIGIMVIGFVAIGLAYAISPTFGWILVALIWFWAFRSPAISDWRSGRRLRKLRSANSASK